MGTVETSLLSRKTIKRNTAVGGDKNPAGSLDSHCGSLGKTEEWAGVCFLSYPGTSEVGRGGELSHLSTYGRDCILGACPATALK